MIFKYDEQILEDLGEGVSRKILAYGDDIMMVEVIFKKGAIGKIHSHVHEQTTYVAKGSFEFDVNGEKVIVNQGDSLSNKSNVPHGTVCLQEGVLIDVFTPKRDDFIKAREEYKSK